MWLSITYFSLHGLWIRDKPVSIVTRLWVGQLRNNGLIPTRGKRLFFSLENPDWLWGTSSFLASYSVDSGAKVAKS
jgi:hypothetical protein